MTTLNPEPTCLSDNETKVDFLNNEAIATSIIKLLLEHPDRPVTIGVHGDWGAGKSSLLEMIETGLENKEGTLCLKFNGWRFQGFEDAKIALLEGIVSGLLEKRPALHKVTDKVKAVFSRIDWLKVAKNAGSLALTAYTGIPIMPIKSAIEGIQAMLQDPAKRPSPEQFGAAFDQVYSLIKPEVTPSKKVSEEISEFRKAFDDLLTEAKISRLVVLIDDLDRCLPDTAIETLEAVRLFVFTSRTAFVIAADEAMIEYAVRKHFPDLPSTTGPHTYARNYLEKLIQVPFRIPALGVTETRIYVTLLLIGAELGENDAEFIKLIEAARELLKRPWIGSTLSATTIKSVLEDKFTRAQSSLALSEQVGHLLATGTKGNPRQIKRFLNALMLRKRTADARGFGDDINLQVLAKIMLAERFLPSAFEHIANAVTSSAHGVCEDIAQLEKELTSEGEPAEANNTIKGGKRANNNRESTNKEKALKSTQLEEWYSSSEVKAWAILHPPLGDLDLRPYLFLIKDRKDYFGNISLLDHLSKIIEQLLGPELLVKKIEPTLKQLSDTEALQVFDAICSRILGANTFLGKPNGIDGLRAVVKAHPGLQSNLITFFEILPSENLGLWIAAGWEDVITEGSFKIKFEKLLEQWATNNPGLKAAMQVRRV